MAQYTCALIADMHQGMLEGMRGLLETMFSSVIMVADEVSLIDAAKRLHPDITIIDLSITPKEKADPNIALRFNQSCPDVQFIIIGVHDDQSVIDRVIADGASGYVFKRKAANDLLSAIDAVLNGKTFISYAEH